MLQFSEGKLSVFQSRAYMTNSIVAESGNSLIIVDPTWYPDEIEDIRQYIDTHYPTHDKYLLITHLDYDHVWGWQAFPDARIICPDPALFTTCAVKCLQEWQEWDQNHAITRPYPVRLPSDIHLPLSSDCELIENELRIQFFAVPGHTADSFAAYIPALKVLVAGDYLSNIEIPWIGTNSTAYTDSLDTFIKILEQHKPEIMVPGHGNVQQSADKILQSIEQAKNYLKHYSSDQPGSLEFVNNYIASFPFPKACQEIHELNKNLPA